MRVMTKFLSIFYPKKNKKTAAKKQQFSFKISKGKPDY